MKKITLFLMVVITISCTQKTEEISDNEITLELIKTFPGEEDEVLLASPSSFVFLEDEIFISDQLLTLIHVFDYEGNVIRQIGEKGSGPCEFMLTGDIEYHNHQLFVNDFGNGRLAIINKQNREVKYTFPEHLPLKFVVHGNEIFMSHQFPGYREDLNDIPLIWHYDLELNLLNSFGNHLTEQVSNMMASASKLFLKIYNDQLYVLFQHYPILQIYNLNGDLEETLIFDHYYKEKISQNYQAGLFSDPSVVNIRSLFGGLDISEEGIFFYVFDYDNSVHHIDHFDFSGNRLHRLATGKNVWMMNMRVETRDNDDIYI